MTATRLPTTLSGSVTNGALIWTGSAWQNALVSPTNIASGYALVRSGSGSPEGVVTAAVGSLYARTNGGAGTTLYVKESGSGNTGWVAK